MRNRKRLALIAALTACTAILLWAFARRPVAAEKGDDGAIRSTLAAQAEAWNRGDIDTFMQSYENSPETTFVGATSIRKGFQPILQRYKTNYSSPEQMGKLTFSDLEVRLLPSSSGQTDYAVATGHFHLDRTARGAGSKDDGIFSLVLHKSGIRWVIVLDHTA